MILVDSSVWTDYFRGTATPQSDLLDKLLDWEELAIGDLNRAEVLQGCKQDREFNDVRRLLGRLDVIVLGGADVAVEAARNFRKLRQLGVTMRGMVDTILATRCIMSGHRLLHSDREFAPFEQHLGLRCVVAAP